MKIRASRSFPVSRFTTATVCPAQSTNIFSPARCSWRITTSTFALQARHRARSRLHCIPSGWTASYSSHSSASVTPLLGSALESVIG